MIITLVAAMTQLRVIGKDNKMPWHIPEELRHFKAATIGRTIVMGRSTFDSIGQKLLPGRKTIVLTKNSCLNANGYAIASSVKNALSIAQNSGEKELVVVGGAAVYQQFLSIADKMILSILSKDYEGNVYFPSYSKDVWHTHQEIFKPEFTVKILRRVN